MLNYLESINVGWINTCKSTIYKLKTIFFLKPNHRKKSSKGLIIIKQLNEYQIRFVLLQIQVTDENRGEYL